MIIFKNHKLKLALALVAAICVIFGWRYWHKHLRFEVFPRNFGVIEENILFRSGKIDPNLLEKTLRKHRIKIIVNLIDTYPPEDTIAEKLGIRVIRMATLKGDGTGDINDYARAIAVMVKGKNKGQPVLLHCAAGTQRTGGVTAAYRLLVEGLEDNTAIIDELERYGWEEKDVALLNFINRNMYALARNLVQRGIIERVPEPVPQIQFEGVTTYRFGPGGEALANRKPAN